MRKKKQIISDLCDIHTELKNHPYLFAFEDEDVSSFKNALAELAGLWQELAFCCADTEPWERDLLKKFTRWTHNFLSHLDLRSETSFRQDLVPYYSAMISITHDYLETGRFDRFYMLSRHKTSTGGYKSEAELYVLITPEMCGMDTKELPNYYSIAFPSSISDKVGRYLVDQKLKRKNPTEEMREELYKSWWEGEVKPLFSWINAHRRVLSQIDSPYRAMDSSGKLKTVFE